MVSVSVATHVSSSGTLMSKSGFDHSVTAIPVVVETTCTTGRLMVTMNPIGGLVGTLL